MASLKTDVAIDLLTTLIDASEGRSNVASQRIRQVVSLASGTTAGKADLVYYDERTLAGSASEVLDLAGSLADAFGNTLTMVKVKLIAIQNRTLTDGVDLQVGPDATNGFTGPWADASDRSIVAAGRVADDYGLFIWYDPNGQTVGAGSSDEINIANASTSTSATYRVLIVATSA